MSSSSLVALRDLTFIHDAASEPLISGLSVHLPVGFTGVVGANGAGKTTLLRLVTATLAPSSGTVDGVGHAVYCEQRTDSPPAALVRFVEDWDSDAFALRGRLEIEPDFVKRWDSLSHGERKRAQIGCALWQHPDVLAIDEPTNHIDARARDLLCDALARFQGVGLIVSHDRDLLDSLCTQCIWLEPPNANVYAGGFTQSRAQRQSDHDTAVAERKKAMQTHRALERELAQRRERAAGESARRSKRGIARHDSDAREKIDRARVTDGKSGAALRQLAGRAAQARARLDTARVDKVYETGIWLPGSRSRRAKLFDLAAGVTALGDTRVLRHPRLTMMPDDRIAITGINGAGKSTLLQSIAAVVNVPPAHVITLPQEIPASVAIRLLDEVRTLPARELGHVMNVVSRLGSRPQRLLESALPSPGEIRKLLLAMGMARVPHLIVMDEPTNHLDLPSIEALESALVDCPCGLLLVSHDQRFLGRLARVRWHIDVDRERNSVLIPA